MRGQKKKIQTRVFIMSRALLYQQKIKNSTHRHTQKKKYHIHLFIILCLTK